MRRAAAALALAGVLLVAGAAPAAAHGASATPTNWRTRILAVEPAVEGLDVRVIDAGSRLELTNRTDTEALVLGYEGEPYLRVGPDGVFENVHSAATWSNRTREGEAPPDGVEVGADVEPEWNRVSGATTVRWHDHRAHWMGESLPPDVAADEDRFRLVSEWEAPIELGDRTVVVRGDLAWVPGPSPFPWLAVGAAAAVAVVVLAMVAGTRPALLAGAAALLAADVVHGVGTAFDGAGGVGSKIGALLGGSTLGIVGWGLAVAALVLLARRRVDGFVAAGLAAAVIGATGGLLELADLTRSQVPFAFPAGVARLVTALSLGLGLAVAGVVIRAVWRGETADVANSSQ